MKKIHLPLLILSLSVCISYGQKPVANFVASKDTICVHDCINFSNLSINATSYKWIFGCVGYDTSTNPQGICYDIGANCYVTLIAYNSHGSDTLTRMNYISVHPKRGSIYLFQDSLHYVNTDSSVISYQWYRNDSLIPGATNKTIVYNLNFFNTNYIIITDIYACSDTIVYYPDVAVKSWFKDNKISVNPNPASNQLTIHTSSSHNAVVTVSVMNVLGEIVQEEKLKWISNINMNINNLPAGIYFLQMKGESGSVVKKFVKE